MERMKKVVSLLLCLVMVVGLLPMSILSADAAGTLIDAAIFCSDVHGNPSTVTSVFNGIKSADSTFNPTTASFVGDTQTTASSVTSAAQEVYSGVQCIYAFGNHDDEGDYGIDDFTGLSYGSSSTNYYIYTISENSMSSSSPDTSGFTSTVATLDKTKPLFIISHMPLHARRNDNNGAAAWYDAISAAAESMDIFFFWAHNHTSEGSADTAAYYVAKNGSETISIQGGSTVTPNFTYANAGYIAPPNTPARNNVATAVRIYDDSVNLTVYNASGELSGTYAVNETVTRQFAGTTDSGDGDSGSTETTTPSEGEDEETTTYNYTATANTDGTGYILVSNGYALQNNGGTIGSVAVTVSDDGSTITFDDSVDVSTILWTIDSDGDVMNDGYYLLRASGSGTKSMTISTTDSGDAYSNWTYADNTLTTTGGSGGSTTFYAYCSSGTFSTQSSSSQEMKFYVPTTGTSSGGGSTEGGDTGDGEDDTTGGSTETVVGDGTYTTADDGSYQKVTFETTVTGTTTKTVYVLSSGNPSGNVLIANSATAGSVNLVANDGGDLSNTSTTVIYGDCDGDGDSEYYIELDDATNELWTVSGSYTFENQDEYLRCSNGNLSVSGSSTTWSYSSNHLSYTSSSSGSQRPGQGGSSSTTYYLRYNNGWTVTSSSSSASSIYFYVPTEVEVPTTETTKVTYSVTASDIEHFYTADESDTETVTITASVTDGTPDGTYAYEVVGGDDIITSISEDGTITFNGSEGTAQLKVSYTWTDGENTYTIWQVIDVTATSPYYTLDLHKANIAYTVATGLTEFAEGTIYYTQNEDGTYTQVSSDAEFDSSETYYTLSYTLGDEITAPIAIKGIEEGDRYGVWAVVKYYDGTTEDGTDMGTVGDAIEWSSSDESIATVDKNTGIITFTGKEGTVQITATYLNGNKPSDTVTISVTQSLYSVPSDGTNDFPEYPNEGAIRYDKTATAVGNFSETGIAMVELSMTGVPYTTGSEIDVVLMLDMTGSMTDDSMAAAEAAALAFAKQIVLNKDNTYNNNRISVQIFNKNGVTELWAMSAVTADTYDSLVTAIESASTKQATGGTPYSTALSGCKDILDAARADGTGNNRQQFCVFVSDGTPTSYTDVDGGSDTTKKEYYSSAMQEDGVTVYGVYTSAAAGSSGSNGSGGSVNDTEEGTAIMQNVASSDDKVYVVEDYTDTSALTGVFTNIAMDILQAATDITVEDQITDEYTMIFDLPEGTKDINGLDSQEFYIEFVKYTLDENHERTDTVTSVTKLYLGTSNGTYYAASDASGTAYAAPVFAQTTIGEKGTLYYWTTDDSYASKAAVTYTNDDDTYYFIPYGMEANEDGTAPDGWYNMTSGAYAYGTVDSTNMSQNLVIATPYFVYNASTKMLYWTVDKLDTAEYALRYFLYLDNSATEVGVTGVEVDAGTYPTNDHAYITYTNFRGNDCQQKFPIPQLTWNGAQVSYVFYLVNSAGQPINKSGQVVDFANATFVTDVYTTAVVWNKGADGQVEGDANLSIDWLASKLLPSDYLLYDTKAGYELKVYADASGEAIFNYFIIEGGTATEISTSLNDRLSLSTTESTVSVETTKVYNTKAGTKYDDYGTYTSKDASNITGETILTGFDFANSTVAFAVVWQPKLVEDVVVVDYGLDVVINVVQNDLLQNTISGIGVGKDAYGNTAMNTGVSTESKLGTAALTIDGNTISIENENAVRFHQGDMTFTEPVKFYYESPAQYYEGSNQKTGYMYSSVTVIPATTIYYEDEYVTLKTYEALKNEDGSTQTDTYGNPVFDTVGTDGWDVSSVNATATQQQDRPGVAQISKDLDADNNYGYDAAYAEMSSHSMDNAAMINVNAYKKGEATFTFYGTGFDIISVTSNMTGTLMVQVTGTTASGASYRKNLMVDTYYGYTQDENGEWVTSVNDPNALYQVPVIKLGGLEYGQYTVKLVAAYNEVFDHTTTEEGTEGSYDLYLDAVRIYDPTGNQNTTANNAYKADGEGWPIYKELRNLVIEANTFGSYLTVDSEGSSEVQVDGAVFIDSDDSTSVISDYISYGPNNELYLAAGQAVAFSIADVFEQDGVENPAALDPVKVQLAIKTVGTSDAKVEIFNPSISTSTTTEGTTQTTTKTFVKGDLIAKTISTATDMYYDITALADGVIVISNPGEEGIISITNLKFTFEEAAKVKTVTTTNDDGTEETSEASVASISEEGAVYSLRALRSYSVSETTEIETEPTEPEATEPETTEPETETTEPETEVTEPETEATEPETETTEPEPDATEPEPNPEDSNTGKTLIKIIKKLLGWLFG